MLEDQILVAGVCFPISSYLLLQVCRFVLGKPARWSKLGKLIMQELETGKGFQYINHYETLRNPKISIRATCDPFEKEIYVLNDRVTKRLGWIESRAIYKKARQKIKLIKKQELCELEKRITNLLEG